MRYFVVLFVVCSVWAYPQNFGFPKDAEFLDVLAKMMIEDGWFPKDDLPSDSNVQLNCITMPLRETIRNVCYSQLVTQPDYLPFMSAECILINIAKALDTTTGIIDVKTFKVASLEGASLSPEQKKSAGDSLESCIESDIVIPPPPPGLITPKYEELNKKYTNRNNPKRAIACAIKALLKNGCSSVAKSAALTAMDADHRGGGHHYRTVNGTLVRTNNTSHEHYG